MVLCVIDLSHSAVEFIVCDAAPVLGLLVGHGLSIGRGGDGAGARAGVHGVQTTRAPANLAKTLVILQIDSVCVRY